MTYIYIYAHLLPLDWLEIHMHVLFMYYWECRIWEVGLGYLLIQFNFINHQGEV